MVEGGEIIGTREEGVPGGNKTAPHSALGIAFSRGDLGGLSLSHPRLTVHTGPHPYSLCAMFGLDDMGRMGRASGNTGHVIHRGKGGGREGEGGGEVWDGDPSRRGEGRRGVSVPPGSALVFSHRV
ncbi:unnamed protein product [Danaus chrysippus]|uniref:(African queen) hypothetical protein n=1 Tax=Danaus chrysippus TaxID=151541 RepID=A0A8J2VS36_9NEOP|nr:unnamed protein product [Danaus chrysippus]